MGENSKSVHAHPPVNSLILYVPEVIYTNGISTSSDKTFVYRIMRMTTPSTALGDPRTRADWRSVEFIYRQFTAIVSKGDQLPTEIAGSLANNLGRVLAFYEDQEPIFIQDLLELWSGTDKLQGSAPDRFRLLYFDKRLETYPEYRFPPSP